MKSAGHRRCGLHRLAHGEAAARGRARGEHARQPGDRSSRCGGRRELFEVDLGDAEALARVFESRPFDAVMHFASFIQVGESVRKPGLYYRNNFANTLNLLDAMVRAGVTRFIFSSTAAIFGEPEYVAAGRATPAAADQSVRDVEADGGARAARLRSRPRAEVGLPALLQCRRCPSGRLDRRAPRAGDALDSAAAAGGGGAARVRQPVRPRLRHAGRHLHTRLHPRGRSLPGAPAGAAVADGRGPTARRSTWATATASPCWK